MQNPPDSAFCELAALDGRQGTQAHRMQKPTDSAFGELVGRDGRQGTQCHRMHNPTERERERERVRAREIERERERERDRESHVSIRRCGAQWCRCIFQLPLGYSCWTSAHACCCMVTIQLFGVAWSTRWVCSHGLFLVDQLFEPTLTQAEWREHAAAGATARWKAKRATHLHRHMAGRVRGRITSHACIRRCWSLVQLIAVAVLVALLPQSRCCVVAI